ncbi:hypothetical protein CYMTET_21869 [Cymbomonas tetramitiformis]|uniref:Uncharacterized protein n=1 Tax=Cymbomonas tetramitiformis TaxID=36881 RepID=A0AAE0L2H7_9CHLO|nr:hypothetical protein CYMTET_21869 [Cymbomonas tetramitiformis]
MAWIRGRGVPTLNHLNDFFTVAHAKEEAEEAMMLLDEFVSFLGFKVFLVCVQHDIRLLPTYIASKDNIYVDLLSKGHIRAFQRRCREDRHHSVWIEDRDDWMLLPNLWRPLDVHFGPFTMPGLGPDGPLFCTDDAKGRLEPLTHSVFVAGFRKPAARAGLDPATYTNHSFRRGGATTTFKLQVQDALI